MSTAMLSPSQPSRPKRWTREEYENLICLGVFDSDDHVELLQGEIVETMPQNSPHSNVIVRLTQTLVVAFSASFQVRIQLPLRISEESVPEPDAAIVQGNMESFADNQPQSALLVIEAADSTLEKDRTTKLEIYAQSGVIDYWIININDRVVEVYREPAAISGTPSGYGYRSVRHYTETEEIAPLFSPESFIKVSAVLP